MSKSVFLWVKSHSFHLKVLTGYLILLSEVLTAQKAIFYQGIYRLRPLKGGRGRILRMSHAYERYSYIEKSF